jgi:hypothetical protein
MRTIRYGAISFKIPEHWLEEYTETGEGIFYKDSPDSGTLRVNVLNTDPHEDGRTETASELVNGVDIYRGLQRKVLPNGDVIVQHSEKITEDGIPLTIWFFDRVHATKDNDFQIAHFSWTIETRFENDQHYQNDLRLVEDMILNVRFKR